MKVSKRRGRVRLSLQPAERQLLAGLFDDLAQALNDLEADDPVRRRLYPDAHRDDPQIAAAFRELTQTGLHEERLGRLERCRAEVAGDIELLDLDAEDVRRWLQVSNDLRLSIGTRLGITDEGQQYDPDGDTRTTQVWAIYHWLSTLQDSLVDAVM